MDVTVERSIAAPIERVAAYAGDPSNAPSWYRRIRSAEWVGEPGVAPGARIRFEARFLGRTLRYTYEIVELQPGRRMVMSTSDGPFPMTTEYTWTPLDGGATLMTLRNHGRPAGFSRLVAPVLAAAMKRAMTGDLRLLAGLLESPG